MQIISIPVPIIMLSVVILCVLILGTVIASPAVVQVHIHSNCGEASNLFGYITKLNANSIPMETASTWTASSPEYTATLDTDAIYSIVFLQQHALCDNWTLTIQNTNTQPLIAYKAIMQKFQVASNGSVILLENNMDSKLMTQAGTLKLKFVQTIKSAQYLTTAWNLMLVSTNNELALDLQFSAAVSMLNITFDEDLESVDAIVTWRGQEMEAELKLVNGSVTLQPSVSFSGNPALFIMEDASGNFPSKFIGWQFPLVVSSNDSSAESGNNNSSSGGISVTGYTVITAFGIVMLVLLMYSLHISAVKLFHTEICLRDRRYRPYRDLPQ